MKSQTKSHSVNYGALTLTYELAHSRRKTLGIRVRSDGSVTVTAPLGMALSDIEQIVLKKAAWIVKHQQQFRAVPRPRAVSRRYVNGEIYRYLGREYPLSIVTGEKDSVRLTHNELVVTVAQKPTKTRLAALIDGWYRKQANRVFTERLAACFPKIAFMNVPMPTLTLRTMKTRWGSCSSRGRVTLNIRLVQMSVDLIDYVVLHELCHLQEMNHSKAFYALMERVLPDWKAHKKRLNSSGVS